MSDSTDFPRLTDEIENGLAAYMTDPELSPASPGRASAIEAILHDWLVAHRYMSDVAQLTPVRLDSEGVNREEVQYPGFID